MRLPLAASFRWRFRKLASMVPAERFGEDNKKKNFAVMSPGTFARTA
jgi:hypothetical protein